MLDRSTQRYAKSPNHGLASTTASVRCQIQSCFASSSFSYHCWSIDLASILGFNEEEDESNEKWGSIGHQVVFPFQCFELLGIVLLEQGQVDIDCHGQIPEGVGRNEPASS